MMAVTPITPSLLIDGISAPISFTDNEVSIGECFITNQGGPLCHRPSCFYCLSPSCATRGRVCRFVLPPSECIFFRACLKFSFSNRAPFAGNIAFNLEAFYHVGDSARFVSLEGLRRLSEAASRCWPAERHPRLGRFMAAPPATRMRPGGSKLSDAAFPTARTRPGRFHAPAP